ncbi:MAG: phenylacetate-CoA oxygenase subunit PaaC [Chloroflexales bacterium]|nr:phenylacetate-CoA oxygenase subunit PaaC [Chloroflexales bacterium]
MSATDLPKTALRELLLALADDEFILGFANSEWTGIAPILEEDIAFSSLSQDEIGHAHVFYELLANLEESDVEALTYGRTPKDYRNTQLVERPRGNWVYTVSRQFLYDTADYVRLEGLQQSSYKPLTQAITVILREEKQHLIHTSAWLQRLAADSPEAQQQQQAAFEMLWPDALAFFQPPDGENKLIAAGVLQTSFAALQQHWLDQIAEPLQRLGLSFPFVRQGAVWATAITPTLGGRRGEHSPSFYELYETITSLYRSGLETQW